MEAAMFEAYPHCGHTIFAGCFASCFGVFLVWFWGLCLYQSGFSILVRYWSTFCMSSFTRTIKTAPRTVPLVHGPIPEYGRQVSPPEPVTRIAVTNDVTNILIEVLIDIKIDLSWKFCAPNGMSAKLILEVLCEWVDAAFGACPCCALTHPGSLLVANWDL